MNLYIILIGLGLIIISGILVFAIIPSKKTVKPQKTGKILVADDTPEILKIVEIILTRAGFTVKTAGSGKEAEEAASKEYFDVIMVDINMPGEDGYAVARTIRASEINRGSHLIALTACDSKELGTSHLDAGFDEAVQKPITSEKLLRKVHLAIAKQEQFKLAKEGKTITSSLTDDPDYKKTIERFVKDLPGKVQAIEDDLGEGNLEQLRAKIHSLKGLGGFAGFPIFTEKARQIEENLTDEKIEEVRKQVNELVLLCKNTRLMEKK